MRVAVRAGKLSSTNSPAELGWLSGLLTVPSSVRSPSPSKRNQLYNNIPSLPPPLAPRAPPSPTHLQQRGNPVFPQNNLHHMRRCRRRSNRTSTYEPTSKSIAFTPPLGEPRGQFVIPVGMSESRVDGARTLISCESGRDIQTIDFRDLASSPSSDDRHSNDHFSFWRIYQG